MENPRLCPLCQQSNNCAIAQNTAANECWCMNVKISTEALSRVPASLINKICICKMCGTQVTPITSQKV